MGLAGGRALDVAGAAARDLHPGSGPHYAGGGRGGGEGAAGDRGQAEIKWPNDLLVDGRKICGILAESSVESVPTAAKKVGVKRSDA